MSQKKAKPRGKPFTKGQSGNPAGRRAGCLNKATRAAEILLDGQASLLTQKAVEMALEGSELALKLCLDRILAPRRERAVPFDLPPLRDPADIARAMHAVTAAVAKGALTPGEAAQFAQIVDTFMRGIETSDFAQRLNALEAREAAKGQRSHA